VKLWAMGGDACRRLSELQVTQDKAKPTGR
jgi:hypothetical protein